MHFYRETDVSFYISGQQDKEESTSTLFRPIFPSKKSLSQQILAPEFKQIDAGFAIEETLEPIISPTIVAQNNGAPCGHEGSLVLLFNEVSHKKTSFLEQASTASTLLREEFINKNISVLKEANTFAAFSNTDAKSKTYDVSWIVDFINCKLTGVEFLEGKSFSKLVSFSEAITIDQNWNHKKCYFPAHITDRLLKALDGFKAIGLTEQDTRSNSKLGVIPQLCLEISWQIIKTGLLANFKNIYDPIISSEDLIPFEEFSSPQKKEFELTLLIWLTHLMTKIGYDITLSNFENDFQDSRVLALVVNCLTPETYEKIDLCVFNKESDPLKRAEIVLEGAKRFGCCHFASPHDIINGNKHAIMHFIAVLYNIRAIASEEEERAQVLLVYRKEDISSHAYTKLAIVVAEDVSVCDKQISNVQKVFDFKEQQDFEKNNLKDAQVKPNSTRWGKFKFWKWKVFRQFKKQKYTHQSADLEATS